MGYYLNVSFKAYCGMKFTVSSLPLEFILILWYLTDDKLRHTYTCLRKSRNYLGINMLYEYRICYSTFHLTLIVIFFRYKTPVAKYTAINMTNFPYISVSNHHAKSIHIRRYTDPYFIRQLWLSLPAVTAPSVWTVGWVASVNRINDTKGDCKPQLSHKVMTTCNEVRPSILITHYLGWQ